MKKLLFALFIFTQVLCADTYTAKDFQPLVTANIFSAELITLHLTLYQGYVKNVNLLLSTFEEMKGKGQEGTYAFSALKRRFSWEFNGMRLHELYFENLGKRTAIDPHSPLFQKIRSDFKSFGAWQSEFSTLGLTRGIGWVVLYLDPQEGKLFTTWIEEHDIGPLVRGIPLLVMDVWEHAYLTEYGLDRKKYIEVFMSNINWDVVAQRLQEVLK